MLKAIVSGFLDNHDTVALANKDTIPLLLFLHALSPAQSASQYKTLPFVTRLSATFSSQVNDDFMEFFLGYTKDIFQSELFMAIENPFLHHPPQVCRLLDLGAKLEGGGFPFYFPFSLRARVGISSSHLLAP